MGRMYAFKISSKNFALQVELISNYIYISNKKSYSHLKTLNALNVTETSSII